MKPFVSIIIPALNEEKYIEATLKSIRNQYYKGKYEIIVADWMSKDDTVKIAKKYADKVVTVKEKGVARGRNIGAKLAKSDVLIFVDADTVLTPNVLNAINDKMQNDKIAGGTCLFLPNDNKLLHKVMAILGNAILIMSTKTKFSYAPAMCTFYRKDIFEKEGGFNEGFASCDDNDLATRIKKHGKFVFVMKPVLTSFRRYEKGGYIKTFSTYITHTIHYLQNGTVPKTKFKLEAIR